MTDILKTFKKIVRQLDSQKREDLSSDIVSVSAALNVSEGALPALENISRESLLAEVARRGLLVEIHGAVGALYDNLAADGVLDDESSTTSYLVYRLRREDAKLGAGFNDSRAAEFWQQKIDLMGRGAEKEPVEMPETEKPGTTVVEFESVWDEGTVTTSAVLNLETGEVTNIESSDDGEEYEHLQYEQICDVSRGVSAIVVANSDNKYFLQDLAMVSQFGGADIARAALPRPRG